MHQVSRNEYGRVLGCAEMIGPARFGLRLSHAHMHTETETGGWLRWNFLRTACCKLLVSLCLQQSRGVADTNSRTHHPRPCLHAPNTPPLGCRSLHVLFDTPSILRPLASTIWCETKQRLRRDRGTGCSVNGYRRSADFSCGPSLTVQRR